jgi:endoglucanase
MKNRRFLFLALLALSVSCGEKNKTMEIPLPSQKPAPTAISLSKPDWAAPTEGGTFTLTISSPKTPSLSATPGWLTLTKGNFVDYKLTVSVKAEANGTYDARTATLTVSAAGVSPVDFKITQAGKTAVPDPTLPNNNAVKRMKELGVGWNLGNQLDALEDGFSASDDKYGWPDETCWSNQKATQQTFDKIKSYGFTYVRIPVTWTRFIGPAPDYTLDATRLERVAEVIDYAHNAGLSVVMDTHHDECWFISFRKELDARIAAGKIDASRRDALIARYKQVYWLNIGDAVNDPALNAEIKAKIRAVWTQLANRFKSYGSWLMFEGFNEINDGGWGGSDDFEADPTRQCNILNEWHQVFVDAVRATGGSNATRWLGVAPYAANPKYVDYLKLPTDSAHKIMVSFHYYDPSEFTIGDKQYSDWGHTGDPTKKDKKGDEDYVKSTFGKLLDKYVKSDIPVYLGEYGCSLRDKNDTRRWSFYLYWLEYVTKAARAYGFPAAIWDAGGKDTFGQEKHCYTNHGTGEFQSSGREPIETIVHAWTTDSSTYTLQSVYDSAPVF